MPDMGACRGQKLRADGLHSLMNECKGDEKGKTPRVHYYNNPEVPLSTLIFTLSRNVAHTQK